MNEPRPRTGLPTWLGGTLLVLLGFQVGLLWMQGSLLERQHGDLVAMRQDIQDLAESLDQLTGAYDGSEDGTARPSSAAPAGRRPLVRVRLQEQDKDSNVPKDIADQRQAERDALAKAREVQSRLSLEENARKAEEKARREAEGRRYRPLVWGGVIVALAALFLRSWLRNRG
ncbi:hypothetical protein [Mesoterricola sediminis]|uniref:Uncharacterized protein n=1 Tax=Mesoterricola sediminis TaxID=2927980 RepID=A0AA48H588_9BACT|nr:hypothetical protein [Mesoterricola sediminis]BDU77641.1 hypothetical protein METESE_25990 [Mesoterricola sediminis]